jgi:hypothetical protein
MASAKHVGDPTAINDRGIKDSIFAIKLAFCSFNSSLVERGLVLKKCRGLGF